MTIIVLLILAGVAISMLSGENGILRKAADAKTKTEDATELERVELAVQASMMNRNGTVDKNELNKELNKIGYNPVSDLPADIEINGEKYTITSNGKVKLKTLKVGDEVTYKGESFYVIGFSTDKAKVNLLAKYYLKADGSSQDTEGNINACAFSSTNYWSSETRYPLGLNNYTVTEGVTSIVTTAKAYGSKLGATGRLMTYEEANGLTTANTDILYGNKEGKTLNYWLGNASGLSLVSVVVGEYSTLSDDNYDSVGFFGLRPVLEVLTSSIK